MNLPFTTRKQPRAICDSHYLPPHSILATRHGNVVMFHHEGGVEVGDVDEKAIKVEVDIEDQLSEEQAKSLVAKAPSGKQQ